MKMPERVNVEGVSLAPAMQGEKIATRQLYWHYPHYGNQGGDPSSIVREGNWKLIYYWEDKSVELYDLSKDPREGNDVAKQNRKVTTKLAGDLLFYLTGKFANQPLDDPEYNAALHQEVLDRNKNVRMPNLEAERVKMLSPGYTPNADWWGSKVTKD